MKFRTVAVSTLWVALFASTFMALRAADPKAKAKDADEVPPSPGTVKFAAAPVAVQKTFAAETQKAVIEIVGKADDGSFYQAIVGIGNPAKFNYRVAVAKDGQLIEKVLEPFRVDVKLEECPTAVQKALKDEVKGATVESSLKVSAAKQIEYVFEVTVKEIDYQLVYMDDGTLISKVHVVDIENGPPPAGNNKVDAPAKKGK